MPRYEATSFVKAIQEFKITETLLIPPILLSLPQQPACNAESLASLRQVYCGGAAVGKGVQQNLYSILHPDARIAQIYGMTELGWVCGSLYPAKDERGSVGVPLKSYNVK